MFADTASHGWRTVPLKWIGFPVTAVAGFMVMSWRTGHGNNNGFSGV